MRFIIHRWLWMRLFLVRITTHNNQNTSSCQIFLLGFETKVPAVFQYVDTVLKCDSSFYLR